MVLSSPPAYLVCIQCRSIRAVQSISHQARQLARTLSQPQTQPKLNLHLNPKQDNLCEELARTAQSLPG
jgi:hypothetical protein